MKIFDIVVKFDGICLLSILLGGYCLVLKFRGYCMCTVVKGSVGL